MFPATGAELEEVPSPEEQQQEEGETPSEEQAPAEQQEDTGDGLDVDELLDGTQLLAGKYKDLPAFVKGHRETERWANTAHQQLLDLGYTFDSKTKQYLPPEAPAAAPPASAAPSTEQQPATVQTQQPTAQPFRFDPVSLDAEADGRHGYGKDPETGEQRWPLDRYGNEIVPPEAWEEAAEEEGWTDSERDRYRLQYEATVRAHQQAGFIQEVAQVQTWGQQQSAEEKDFIENFAEGFPVLPAETAKKIAAHYAGQAKALLEQYATPVERVRPGNLRDMANVIVARDIANKNFAKVMQQFAAQGQKPTTNGAGRRVVSTRLVQSGQEDAGAPPTQRATGALDRLTPAQRAQVEATAAQVGVNAERLAKRVLGEE